jgi:hypothetical protein
MDTRVTVSVGQELGKRENKSGEGSFLEGIYGVHHALCFFYFLSVSKFEFEFKRV